MATAADRAPLREAQRAGLDALDLYDVRASLGDEERMVQESVARLVDDRVLPVIQKHFEEHTFPRDLIPEIASLGLLGSSISGHGCAGMNAVSYGLICQELERGDSGIRSFVSVQSSLCMYPIDAYGSDAQKEKYLPRMAAGELIGCFGLTEPHGGSDPSNMKTHAKRRGRDWVLNGAKMWITNAPIADLAVVWARTEDGIRGFLVEKGTRGFAAPEIERKFSLRASSTGALFFEDVVVPEENMLPGSTVGLKAPLSCLTQARFGITWGVIGAAQACLAQLLDYTQSRVLFGRPLAANQAIQIRLAEMARGITCAQLLSLQLGRLKDAGRLHPTQVSLAKWNNCRMALDVARDARDMLGGAGISAEYVPIRHALNLESVITYEGTETIHQLTIGRELTGINAF
jgi:glutaryl-CoA dehydrogenase